MAIMDKFKKIFDSSQDDEKIEEVRQYEYLDEPFEFEDFYSMTKAQAKEYFEWFMEQVPKRIEQLEWFINLEREENNKIILDYTPESLIPLWDWFEDNGIIYVKKQKRNKKRIKRLSMVDERINSRRYNNGIWLYLSTRNKYCNLFW